MKRKQDNGHGRHSKTTGVSLTEEQREFTRKRAGQVGISFSRYVQALIEYDRTKDVLGAALTAKLKSVSA